MTTQANPAPPDKDDKPLPPPAPPKVFSGYLQVVDEDGNPVAGSETITTWYSSDYQELLNIKTQLGTTSKRLGKARFTIRQLKEDNRKKRERIKELERLLALANS